jgi:hypothetical protein
MNREDLTADLAAANSPDWRERAAAGGRLAQSADQPEAAHALTHLLHHPGDTAVLDAVTRELLHRNDLHGLRLIAGEWGDPADVEHLDHLYGEIGNYLNPDGPIRRFLDLTDVLSDDPVPAVRTGARQLHDEAARWLPPPPPDDLP